MGKTFPGSTFRMTFPSEEEADTEKRDRAARDKWQEAEVEKRRSLDVGIFCVQRQTRMRK